MVISSTSLPRPCMTCGKPLAPGGECLPCAMKQALEAATQNPEAVGDVPERKDGPGYRQIAEPVLPRDLGHYRLLRQIGSGGMGTVYEAEDTDQGRRVALKMIRAYHFSSKEEMRRFQREAEAISRLDDPHIVPFYELGEIDGHPYFAMQLISGGTLAHRLKEGPLPAAEAVRLMCQVAGAVHHAHEKGVLHRDLKPSNILIDENGQAWLSDFGMARLIHRGDATKMPTLTATGIPIGTPHYMSPEQAAGHARQIGPASDVWALGILLYQMLTALPPYEGESSLIVMHKVVYGPPPRYLAPTRDQMGLSALIERCLQKEPSRRLASAGVLVEELERWQRGEKMRTQPVMPWEKGLSWVWTRPAMVAALVALFALAVGSWLMPPADDYVISAKDGMLMITSQGKENGILELLADAKENTLMAVAEGRSFRVSGVSRTGNSGALALAGVRRLVIETGHAQDRVKFRGGLTLEKDATLEVRPQAAGDFSEIYVDQLAELRTSGTGSLKLSASGGIEVGTDAVLEVENGPLQLAGNWPPVRNTASFHGLLIKGPVRSTGTGAVTLQGHAGGQPTNMGVVIYHAPVTGGRAGAALMVEGECDAAAGRQLGVSLSSGGQITSLGGDVLVKGRAQGSGGGKMCFGVDVRTEGEITAGGLGKVHVEGVAGPGSGGEHMGVHVISGGRIASNAGAVSISGTALESGVGVRLSDGSVSAGGSGSLTITGTGALGGGKKEDAYGVELRKKPGTRISTEGGEVTITGKGGSAEVADIFVAAGAQIDTQEFGGKITLNGERQSIALGSVREGVVAGEGPKPDWIVSQSAGALRIRDYTGLGGVIILEETAQGQIQLVLAPESLVQMPDSSRLTGGTAPLSLAGVQQLHFQLGDGDDRMEFHGFSGDAFPSLSVDAGPGDDQVQFRGRLSLADGQSVNVDLQDDAPEPGADSVVLTPGATIIPHGKGSITMRASRKIVLTEAAIRTEDGDIVLEANQQAQPSTGSFRGVDLIGSQLVSEGTGAITISGRGGNEGNFQFGIKLDKGSLIQGGSSGRVSLNGTGGDNGLNDNTGIGLEDAESQILSRGADIELHGTGMGKPGSGYNFGIALLRGRIAAAGAGKVSLTGQGGATLGWHNAGVLVRGAVVTSENGPLTVSGLGGGAKGGKGGHCHGVLVHAKGSIGSMGSGSVTVEGTGGTGIGEEHQGVVVHSEGKIFSSGGEVKVTGTAGIGGVGVLLSGGSLQSGGTGALTLTGTGVRGYAADGNIHGIMLAGEEGTRITSTGGAVRLTGQSGKQETAAILAEMPARISTGGGKVTLIGAKLDLAEGAVDKDAELKAQP